jgi:hypothetical protein
MLKSRRGELRPAQADAAVAGTQAQRLSAVSEPPLERAPVLAAAAVGLGNREFVRD